MNFKKCNNCCKTIIESNEKCPYCGSDSFSIIENSDLEIMNKTKTQDYEKNNPGGSFGLGIVLGLFFGFFGLLIAFINKGKEQGKTIWGVVIGTFILCFIFVIIWTV